MAASLGIKAVVEAASAQMPADLSGTTAIFDRNMQPILVANGANPLLGYAPGQGKSGFNLAFLIPKVGAAAFLNGLLDTAGITAAAGYGTAGGTSVASCLLETLVCQSSGLYIQGAATFQSKLKPVPGFSASPSDLGKVFLARDTTSFTGVSGTTYTKFSQWSFELRRTLVPYFGFSPNGLPLDLDVAYTEAMLTARYQKLNDGEETAALDDCPITSDCSLLITDVCGGISPATLGFVVTEGFYGHYPQTSGQTIGWIEGTVVATADRGGFSIN